MNAFFLILGPDKSLPMYNMKWSEVKSLSRVWLFVTPWTIAYKAPLSMEFSRQEYWSGLPFPSPGDLPNSGIEPGSPVLQAYTLPWEPPVLCYLYIYKYSREWTIQQEKEKRKKKKNIKLPLFAGDWIIYLAKPIKQYKLSWNKILK